MTVHAGAGADAIRIAGVRKVFESAQGPVVALERVDLDIPSGQFVCLLGPSGCGKSTLLNAIAGFAPPSQGEIHAGGVRVSAPGPDRGMVFQEYALFPWMTVFDNVAFGLQIRGEGKAAIRAQVDALLHLLGLREFAQRYPKDLSGGMRQRVAIARVLALDPPILLMDEPFGALDALTRRSLQGELLKLWERLQKTVVFVTHSIEESLYLADRVVVMTVRPGAVKADLMVDLPRPRDPVGADFNVWKGRLSALVMAEQLRLEDAERHASTGD